MEGPFERDALLGKGAAAIDENKNRKTMNKCKGRESEVFIKPPYLIGNSIIGDFISYAMG
jgi:hypothetical protein